MKTSEKIMGSVILVGGCMVTFAGTVYYIRVLVLFLLKIKGV